MATALTLVAAGYAKAQGYRQIVTAPRRTNVASRGANARVGFRPREDAVQSVHRPNIRYAAIRKLLQHLEGLPAWRFAAGAIGILGLLRAALGDAALRQNEGAFELFSILRFVAAIGVLFLLVQRRQTDAWSAAIQGAIIGVASQVLALLLMLPFMPSTLPSGESVAFGTIAAIAIQGIGAALRAAGGWSHLAFPLQETQSPT